jgi:hypothetical protein
VEVIDDSEEEEEETGAVDEHTVEDLTQQQEKVCLKLSELSAWCCLIEVFFTFSWCRYSLELNWGVVVEKARKERSQSLAMEYAPHLPLDFLLDDQFSLVPDIVRVSDTSLFASKHAISSF